MTSNKAMNDGLATLKKMIEHLEEVPDSGAYSLKDIEEEIAAAKAAGVDVAEFEELLPALSKKVMHAQIKHKIDHLERIPDSAAHTITDIRHDLAAAKQAGVDVNAVEITLPNLEKKVIFAQVARKVRHLELVPNGKAYDVEDIKRDLEAAKASGVEVVELEAALARIGKR